MTSVFESNTQSIPQQNVGDEKPELKNVQQNGTQINNGQEKNSQQHPLHQYDLTIMAKFYESCVGKLKEHIPKFQPTEWANNNPMPGHLSWEQKYDWQNPLVLSQKQHVYESFARLARESGEPMILMPNFDYGDIMNFERFLQALKQDGINSIGKYKQYLANKDMRKFEVDLVVIHPRYGVLLFEVKECDHLDNKRRIRAKTQLNNARSCFESMARLVIEAKGLNHGEARIPVTEFVVLPNVNERPVGNQNGLLQTPGGNQNVSASSTTSNGRNSRSLNYIIKSDLENNEVFQKWWREHIVEPKEQQLKQAEADNKVNKFDATLINWMLGLINCIRNNSILPVVYPETGEHTHGLPSGLSSHHEQQNVEHNGEHAGNGETTEQGNTPAHKPEEKLFQPALNIHAEFFQPQHEKVRAQPKVFVISSESEKIRKTICLQTLWLLLNDSQKKISLVCSEVNKPYYEEFFSRQRKIYNNLNNLRIYTDFKSCAVNGQHTLKNNAEVWFFDNGVNGTLGEIVERIKELNSFWVFTTQQEEIGHHQSQLDNLNVKSINMDQVNSHHEGESKGFTMPWLTGASLKLPLRLQCDLLIIGDLIGINQVKNMYRYLKTNSVINQASNYQHPGSQYHYQHGHPKHQQLSFNPTKKCKTIKFVRGGTIDNLRNSLKMHDSIESPVILLHIGDEDLFKTRNSVTTIERVKELATLVKEYCPNSFVVLSTLMRRMSRTENGVTNEVNKGIINFCKQTRDSLNLFYMLNNHFEPDYHTQEGRLLSNKGLRLYIENVLFVVDYFLFKNNKQH